MPVIYGSQAVDIAAGLACTTIASGLTYYCTCKYADIMKLLKGPKYNDEEENRPRGGSISRLMVASPVIRPVSYFVFLLFLVALIALDFAALALLPLCYVAPVSMMMFVWGYLYKFILYPSYILSHRVDFFLVLSIFTFIAVALVFAPTAFYVLHVNEIVKFNTTSVFYTVIFIGTAIFLHLLRVEKVALMLPGSRRDKKTVIYSSLAGILGGQSLVLLKLFAEIIEVGINQHSLIFTGTVTFVVISVSMAVTVLHAIHMHLLLRSTSDLNTLMVIPIHRAALIISALAGSAAYLQEFVDASTVDVVVYSLSITVLLVIAIGLALVNAESTDDSDDASVESSLWNIGNLTGRNEDSDEALFYNASSRTIFQIESFELADAEKPIDYNYPQAKNSMMVREGVKNPHCSPGNSYWIDAGEKQEQFKVRGPTYLEDKVKMYAGPSSMQVVSMQWSNCPCPIDSLGQHPGGFVQSHQAHRKDRPFMFIVNFMIPSLGNYVTYHVLKPDSEDYVFIELMNSFVNSPDDEFRKDRFKLIPSVIEGSYFVRRAVGSTPALLCKKLTTTFYKSWNCDKIDISLARGEWFEVSIDISSSKVARSIMGAVKGFASGLVLHLGYLIESKSKEELPERLIGCIDLYRPAMSSIAEHDSVLDAVPSEDSISDMMANGAFGEMFDSSSDASYNGDSSDDDFHSIMDDQEVEYEDFQVDFKMNGNSFDFPVPIRTMVLPGPGTSSYWEDAGSEPGGWMVRGPSYKEDSVKVPCGAARMKIVGMDWLYSPLHSIHHMGAESGRLVQTHHQGQLNKPFLLIVNFLVPSVGNFVTYLSRRMDIVDTVFDDMLSHFIDHPDDEYRNSRLKLIPGVLSGSYFVRKAVGAKPALLCKKLTTTYFRGDNYFEISIDVGSSVVGARIFSAVKGFASGLTLHLGVCIESKTRKELPEKLLFGIDIYSPAMKPETP